MKLLNGSMAEGRIARHPESGFAGSFLALAVIGFIAMWSASAGFGLRLDKGANFIAIRQAIFYLPAIAIFIVASKVSLDSLRNLAGPLALASLFSLVVPFIPGIGVELNGSRRWINLFVTNFQPSELWKPISIIYAAHILDKKNQTIRNTAGEAIFPSPPHRPWDSHHLSAGRFFDGRSRARRSAVGILVRRHSLAILPRHAPLGYSRLFPHDHLVRIPPHPGNRFYNSRL